MVCEADHRATIAQHIVPEASHSTSSAAKKKWRGSRSAAEGSNLPSRSIADGNPHRTREQKIRHTVW